MKRRPGRLWPCALLAWPALAFAQADAPDTLLVRARAEDLQGVAQSASEGVVAGERLASVPLLRPGEALEMVPGLIVTQHAGDGKANQYFLRGFNLDHGTDFATTLAGVPLNMPTHAHGQGYTDLNVLIPELVQQIRYRKGPYFADEGDFASAGAAHIDYRRQLDEGLASLTLGARGHVRTLLADSAPHGDGHWLYGLELFHNDGPWTVPEDLRKRNAVLRYSQGSALRGWSLTAMAYQSRWTSTDQVPQRALAQGLIGRFDSLDPSSGGQTARHSLAAEWADVDGGVQRKSQLWALQSALDLWSNFSYQTRPEGDQFQQSERRQAAGARHSRQGSGHGFGHEIGWRWGVQARTDQLAPVALYHSAQRVRLSTVREDRVQQHSLGLWGEAQVAWRPWLRSVAGLRADAQQAEVRSPLAANSGRARDQRLSPKLSLVLGPWLGAEWYLSQGRGFHSNDARGSTTRVDPNDPAQALAPVRPLVRTRGEEIGVRAQWWPGWTHTLALWQLQMDSELVFVGDAGTTEASRPSRRRGLEWHQQIALGRHWAFDADLAWSSAHFTDGDPQASHIPGAASTVANLGLSWHALGPWSGALRLRYWGARPLSEDNAWRARAAAWLNLRAGYRIGPRDSVHLSVYNLLNRRLEDIAYAYPSRLAGEPAAVMDTHVHPAEPRSLRLDWQHRF